MRGRGALLAAVVRHTISGTWLVFALAACGGGGGGSPGGGDGGGDGNGGGTPTLPTSTSSSQSAYVAATTTGWNVVPLLTVGDMPSGTAYAMVGKPDGLGAIAGRVADDGSTVDTGRVMTVLMNHELRDDQGVARAHGTRGAFVSQWTFDLDTLQVAAGRDLATQVFAYAGGAWSEATGTLAFDRLCSATLAPRGAFYNTQSGNGYDGRIFTTGEEVELTGRAFAFFVGGTEHGRAYELPALGRIAYENVVPHPASGDATVVVALDDDSPGEVYVYVGQKGQAGGAVERAGLHGGRLYGVRVTDGGANYGGGSVAIEDQGAVEGRFELVEVTDKALGPGTELHAAAAARGVTGFSRPEDGAWDPRDADVFYWATTGSVINGVRQSARLYRLTFDSVQQPTGGTIELVVDASSLTGKDGQTARGFDNLVVDAAGRVLLQEDGGDDDYVSKLWRIDPATGAAEQAFESDRSRFLAGGNAFLTSDEENSGVIEVTDLVRDASWYDSGRRYYLGTHQAHYRHATTSLVEGGQLYLFASPK